MRKLTSILAFAALGLVGVAQAKTIQITVDGLVCAFCAQGIEKKMKAQAATDKVFVSLEKKIVAVSLKDGQDISDEKLKAEIADSGYVVKGISRSDESLEAIRARVKARDNRVEAGVDGCRRRGGGVVQPGRDVSATGLALRAQGAALRGGRRHARDCRRAAMARAVAAVSCRPETCGGVYAYAASFTVDLRCVRRDIPDWRVLRVRIADAFIVK
jgi:copper chaperone CopZ